MKTRMIEDRIRCIHIDDDICYCGCPKCKKECTIEKQEIKNKKPTEYKYSEREVQLLNETFYEKGFNSALDEIDDFITNSKWTYGLLKRKIKEIFKKRNRRERMKIEVKKNIDYPGYWIYIDGHSRAVCLTWIGTKMYIRKLKKTQGLTETVIYKEDI